MYDSLGISHLIPKAMFGRGMNYRDKGMTLLFHVRVVTRVIILSLHFFPLQNIAYDFKFHFCPQHSICSISVHNLMFQQKKLIRATFTAKCPT